jgi:nucleoside-diphosphate-sugar epimerase
VRVLVTGGGGFIGSHLVERLVIDGHEVRVLDNFTTGRRENLAALQTEVELVEGDVRSFERVLSAVRGTDLVLHHAALPSVPRSVQDPLTTNAVNATGTLSVLLAARDAGVKRVIFASSSSVYGPGPELPKGERLRPRPISPYAVAKLAAEGYCASFHHVYGLETVVLRYFNVFGPRQDPLSEYAAVIPRFIVGMARGEALTVYGDGTQSRDFTYVENVVEANMLAMRATEASGRVFNVACGSRVTINHLVDELRAVMGTTVEVIHAPARPGEVRESSADISQAETHLLYRPRVSLREGLRRTVPLYAPGQVLTVPGRSAMR